MELKDYQSEALTAFAGWRDALEHARHESQNRVDTVVNAGLDPSEGDRDFPRHAWDAVAQRGGVAETAGPYISRTDDAGRPIPHICFKVPTGGGKTLLAAATLERLGRQTGLTLWITPTRAIYEQTKTALKSREHPYRQMLERGSGGRVKLLEKEDTFTRADIDNYMCVMLLMLPAANRQKGREFLRMFRDSGRYPTFFPDGDDALGDAALLGKHSDLERNDDGGPVKHSLFNLFKMLRPVVILDEAHKAYGAASRQANEEFVRSVNRLDPRMVIELSATPNSGISNLLVDISGIQLKNEEMIKLPVQVMSSRGGDWQYTLSKAHSELESLSAEASSLRHEQGRYIRPISVVRVERTGRDQRDGERIHSEDVKEYLIRTLGVPEDQVAIKSAEKDDLGRADLLSEYSEIRWIITKAALMEGWDCPFAYVLVMLDNTSAQKALTQLVGRVLRQPHARRTGREVLDQCYVFSLNTHVGKAVEQVKLGLEQEGLTGLGGEVLSSSDEFKRVTVDRRDLFRDREIFLPRVLHQEGLGWTELDYQRHILPAINWSNIEAPDPQSSMPEPAQWQSATVDVGDIPTIFHGSQSMFVDKTLSLSWFARRLSEVIPNAWQAARIAQDMLDRLRAAGQTDEDIYDRRTYLAESLRKYVQQQVDAQAKKAFTVKFDEGLLRFDLEAGIPNFRLKDSYDIPLPASASIMAGNDGKSLQLSLFEPVYTHEFDNETERNFAKYLDQQKALEWWHRVAVRQRGDYYLRGWRQERIWPDFVAMGGQRDEQPHLLVFELKGQHIEGNEDTDYKRQVLASLQSAFNSKSNHGDWKVVEGPMKGTFKLIVGEEEFPSAMANLDGHYKLSR